MIKKIILLSILIITFFFYKLIRYIFSNIKNIQEYINQKVKATKVKAGSYEQNQLDLSRYGIMFHFDDYNMTYIKYIYIRLFVSFICSLVGYAIAENIIGLIIGFPIGYVGFNMMFKLINENDNKQILEDIYQTYVTLSVQLSAGLYITDCLSNTYPTIKTERYKQALGELITNLADKTLTIKDSITHFQNRFHSREINRLCNFLESIMNYGYSEEYMNNILDESNSLINAFALEKQSNLERKVGGIVFAFFAIIIALIVYLVYTQFYVQAYVFGI